MIFVKNIFTQNLNVLAIAFFVGFISVYLTNESDSVFLLILIPSMAIMSFFGEYGGEWPYIISISYCLTLSLMFIYIKNYFISNNATKINSLMYAMVGLIVVHIVFSSIAAGVVGNTVKGAGEALGVGIKTGVLDRFYK